MKMIYKFMIKWYLSSESDLPIWLKKKANSDRDLAIFLKGETKFNGLLSKSFDRNMTVNDESLANSILKAIDDSSNQESESSVIDARSHFMPLALSVAGIAAMLVLTLTLWEEDHVREVEKVKNMQLAQVEPTETEMPVDVIKTWKNPLDQEIEYVVSDAKGALLFLANNFLPKDYVDTLEDSSSSS